MPWVNPKDENDMTPAEFDAFLEKCSEEDDHESITSDHVWVEATELFDHSTDEIREMEERDKENGEFYESAFSY